MYVSAQARDRNRMWTQRNKLRQLLPPDPTEVLDWVATVKYTLSRNPIQSLLLISSITLFWVRAQVVHLRANE